MNNGPFLHFRSALGTALCKNPAKQQHLVDDWATMTCPHCAKVFRDRMTAN